jgi:hypothetical protein
MADKEGVWVTELAELVKPGDTPPVGPEDPQGP